jgi:uncharacterized protein
MPTVFSPSPWSADRLAEALMQSPLTRGLRVADISADGVIHVVCDSHGGLDVFVSLSEAQIVVSSILAPVSSVRDAAQFNGMLLEMQRVIPLSNFSITTLNGAKYYEIIGEISVRTSVEDLLEEIAVLADNALESASMINDWNTKA